jgi:predicted nucleotidyltransferase
MRLENYSPEKLKKEILIIAGEYLDLKKYKIFFFGSRVTGGGSEKSDIDLGIEGPKEIKAGIKLDIIEKLDNLPILYKLDLVDFKKVSADFRKLAMKKVEYLN